jgi:hypothetical protein
MKSKRERQNLLRNINTDDRPDGCDDVLAIREGLRESSRCDNVRCWDSRRVAFWTGLKRGPAAGTAGPAGRPSQDQRHRVAMPWTLAPSFRYVLT